jgi:hypothetical protein
MTSLPPNLKIIGGSSFSSSNITIATLPETVETIGNVAFSRCNNVTITKLPDALISLGNNVFEFTPIAISELPSGLNIQTLPTRVFDRTKIITFTIPERITQLGQLALYAGSGGQLGTNPVRNFTCRSETLPTLIYDNSNSPFGPKGTNSNNTTVHILKKASGSEAYTEAGVTLAYLTQKITVSISGEGTVSVAGSAVDTENQGTVSNNDVIDAYEAEKITFTFTPVGGYKIGSAKLNGVDITGGEELTIDSDSEKTLSIVFDLPNSIEPVDASDDISIYPNPATDIVNIKGDLTTTARLFDSPGRKIAETTENVIDVSSINPGIYMLKVNQKTFKIIKK